MSSGDPVDPSETTRGPALEGLALGPELARVLFADDLDELLSARRALGEPSDEDAAVVRAVLVADVNEQAIANLLFRPSLIPEPERHAAITAALSESAHPYRTLAAVVGLQHIDPDALAADVRDELVQLVLDVLERTNDVRAQRASVTVTRLVTPSEAERLLPYADHSDGTVSHNIIAWFLKTFDSAETLTAALSECPARTRVLAALSDHQRLAESGEPSSLSTPLYAYIPNLSMRG